MKEKEWPSNTGTKRRKKSQPHNWTVGANDPRTHFMYRTYISRKAQASFRNEEWDFTFDEWFAIWDDRFDERGRGANQYSMARLNMDLPWSKDNCAVMLRKEQVVMSTGMHSCKKVSTPLGEFNNQVSAAKAHDVTLYQFRKWMVEQPDKYYKVNKK